MGEYIGNADAVRCGFSHLGAETAQQILQPVFHGFKREIIDMGHGNAQLVGKQLGYIPIQRGMRFQNRMEDIRLDFHQRCIADGLRGNIAGIIVKEGDFIENISLSQKKNGVGTAVRSEEILLHTAIQNQADVLCGITAPCNHLSAMIDHRSACVLEGRPQCRPAMAADFCLGEQLIHELPPLNTTDAG